MKKIYLFFLLVFLGTSCKPPDDVPPAPEGEKPLVEARFVYPSQDTTTVKPNDTLRITLQFRSEAGMHELGFRIENLAGEIIEQHSTHTHQGSLYFYDTLWVVKPGETKYRIVGVNIDHLNNVATDTIFILVNG